MSNPQTYYTYESLDLSSIFQPLSLGTAYPNATGYKIPDGRDLNEIFASGNNLGYNVGYKYLETDLSQIFAKYNSSPFNYTITNNSNVNRLTPIVYNGYTGLILQTFNGPSSYPSNATCNITFSGTKTINILLVGGGGGAGCGNSTCGGGGGAGSGFIYTSFTCTANSPYFVSIGYGGYGRKVSNGGYGGSTGQTGGGSTFSLSPLSLTTTGGEAGKGIGTAQGYAGGGGGSATSTLDNTGGGGGGGGGGSGSSSSGAANNSSSTLGYLNSSHNPGNQGGTGSTGNPGNGGSGSQRNNLSVSFPFLSSGSIYFGNGGGGGSNSSTGGKAGSSTGGTGYGATDTNGENARYGSANGDYFYGNGGGGGCGNSGTKGNFGGSGSAGVCVLWWQN